MSCPYFSSLRTKFLIRRLLVHWVLLPPVIKKQQCSLSSVITPLHAAICHSEESRKAWREGDRTLTMCTSPCSCVYTSRASAERPVLLAFLTIGSAPTKRHWYSLQSSEWTVLLSETLRTAGFDLPSNRALLRLCYFVAFRPLKYFLAFGNLVSVLLHTIWSAPYADRWE